MVETIHSLMLKENNRIEQFIDKFEKQLDNYEKTLANFNKLKWNVQKHFFVEENAIFRMFATIKSSETADLFHLLSDHSKIIHLLKKIEEKLNQKIKPETKLFKEIFIQHRKFEDEIFYPKLDEELDVNQKKEIAVKIKQVILA